jgi:hypothetical protein
MGLAKNGRGIWRSFNSDLAIASYEQSQSSISGVREIMQVQEKVKVSSDWKTPKKELPREGEMCLVLTDATAVPIYCTFMDGLFYVVTTKFTKKNFHLKLDELTGRVNVLGWRSNFGTLLLKNNGIN